MTGTVLRGELVRRTGPGPEVLQADEVWPADDPWKVGDLGLLRETLDHVRDACARLEECGPEAREVGRWLRGRAQSIQLRHRDL